MWFLLKKQAPPQARRGMKHLKYIHLILFAFLATPALQGALMAQSPNPLLHQKISLPPLVSTENKELSPSSYPESWVAIYFYPKSFTPGCTAQSCSLRDGMRDLKALNIQILGVSFDSPSKLRDFKEKHQLSFPLLSDAEKKWATALGAKGFMGLIPSRKTFLIDPQGHLRAIIDKVDTENHARQIKEVYQGLSNNK
jgi:peroxiredoxin Q/BCP